jgi:hypothetical protein
MAVPTLLSTELIVHVDRKVCAIVSRQEAVEVIGRLTVWNKSFADTVDQWTEYDADVLEKAASLVRQAVKANKDENEAKRNQAH